MFGLKRFLKKYPKIFFVLYHVLVIFTGKSARGATRDLSIGSVILNLGSGTKVIRQDVINADFYPHPGVTIIADVYKLPFKENSVDAVIAESLYKKEDAKNLLLNKGLRDAEIYFCNANSWTVLGRKI